MYIKRFLIIKAYIYTTKFAQEHSMLMRHGTNSFGKRILQERKNKMQETGTQVTDGETKHPIHGGVLQFNGKHDHACI